MIEFLFAAARRAVPAAPGRTLPFVHSRPLPGEHRPGVLSREDLRRAVAEVIG